ncbi:Signal transduction histidine kinase [Nakamurella panacisegetis]|uniref:histidine kinase n=1 Tax=Nakamurella panacisegetis TaxID=1090615 RepID=A0A1H0KRU9_9ACTN|nr:histidine kinase [Nakamurella panacisegetis]SDO58513.1 Signal transduction histidine kinase [Nakamurella panacisegetis]
MRTAKRWWRAATGPLGRDVAVTALSMVYTVVSVFIDVPSFGGSTPKWLVAVLGVLGTAALLLRRRYPIRVGLLGIPVVLLTGNPLPTGFALMRVAIVRRDRVLVAATVIAATAFAAPVPGSGQHFDANALIGGTVGALIFALWGAYIGVRRDLITSLQERADRAEAEREIRAEQARLAERARIAGEMHDVLAHKMSLIALQAGGLEVNAAAGPEVVERTAALLRVTARQALEDLREVLGVLRSDGQELRPQPELGDLEPLVESSRAAGVPVSLDVTVPVTPPAAVGRAVYRIVQECLTNVHKHARGAATTITVTQEGSAITTVVTNRRPVSAGSLLPGAGSGLIGLRERISVLGGTLRSGQDPDGGWTVVAVIPVGAQRVLTA